MATTTERQEGGATERRPRVGWATVAIATVALVAMAVCVVVLAQSRAETRPAPVAPANDPVNAPTVAAPTFGSLWCEDELEVIRAVEAGILPRKVLDDEPYRTKRLIGQGLVPRQAAEPCE